MAKKRKRLRDPIEATEVGHKARLRVLDNFTHKRRMDQLRKLASKKM